MEHEFEDTLYGGTRSGRPQPDMTGSTDEQGGPHVGDESIEMDVAVDEKTLRAMRRSRYLRSAAVTGIFVLLWCVTGVRLFCTLS